MSTATMTQPETHIKVDNERVDRLKEQHMTTPQEIDNERVRIMAEVYEGTAGYQQIIRRAKFFEQLIERKKLYIDENLIVGSMASTVNAVYTYPEWNVEWMKEEKTVENSKTPEDRKANQWALEYWDKWALRPRADEIFIKKYGFDPDPVYQAGLMAEFMSWPGGGGNLNYPRVYNEGLASMIKEVEERQKALDMRLPNASKFYFYEACLITMRAIIRLAHRYAELAREMAAKEKNAERKQELLDIAEVCEWVPEHPARNLREAIQCHFLCHICAEIEQVGCGYSEAYLGQNFEPFYQRDKAAGLIGPEEATYLLKLLFIKLNEIGYYYGAEGRAPELRRPRPEHHPRRLHRGRGRRHRGDGLPDPRCGAVPPAAPAAAVLLLHGEDERQVPGEGPRRHRHRRRHAAVRQRRRDDQARPEPLREQQEGHHARKGHGAPVSAPAWAATSPMRPGTPWKGSRTSGRFSS